MQRVLFTWTVRRKHRALGCEQNTKVNIIRPIRMFYLRKTIQTYINFVWVFDVDRREHCTLISVGHYFFFRLCVSERAAMRENSVRHYKLYSKQTYGQLNGNLCGLSNGMPNILFLQNICRYTWTYILAFGSCHIDAFLKHVTTTEQQQPHM